MTKFPSIVDLTAARTRSAAEAIERDIETVLQKAAAAISESAHGGSDKACFLLNEGCSRLANWLALELNRAGYIVTVEMRGSRPYLGVSW